MISKGYIFCSAALCLISVGSAVAQNVPAAFMSAVRYDASGKIVGTISADPDAIGSGNPFIAVRTQYDAAGRPEIIENGVLLAWKSEAIKPQDWGSDFVAQKSVTMTYDAMGRKLSERSSGGSQSTLTQFSYDLVGRLECTAVRMNPAAFGSLPSSACTLGSEGAQGPDRITKNVYDAAAQLLKVMRAFGTSVQQDYVSYTYTSNGKQATVTDANGNIAAFEYDGYDRLTRWRFPSKTTVGQVSSDDYEEYSYDDNGNRTALRRRDGRILGFTYDALNRVTVKGVPDGCAPIQVGTCTPAASTRDVYYGYDLRGLQTYARFDNAGGEGVSSVYDGFGQLTSTTTTMGGTSRTLGYQYDPDGNRTRITYPDGMYFTTIYDGLNRIFRVGEYANQSGLLEQQYIAQGELQTRFVQNGSTSYVYDAIGRLSQLQRTLAGGTASQTAGFAYNAASQVVQRTNSNDAYAWTGAIDTDRAYTTNGLNQYTTAGTTGFQYDANGNLAVSGSTGYVYDAENRLVNTSTGASLAYDPLGRLFKVWQGSAGGTQYLYDGDQMVAEYNDTNVLLRRYFHGPGDDDPLIWYEGSAIRFLHADHQGSIVAVSDSGGNAVAINTYDEYGIPGSANIGRFQYTGQAWIPELGMYHYKARVYSPTLGRFLQTDPIGYDDQINLYAYVANDPVNGRDPTGQETRRNETPGRRIVVIPQGRATHIRDGHSPDPYRNGGKDQFRRDYSDNQLRNKAGYVVSQAVDQGSMKQEGDRMVYEARTGNIVTDTLFGTEGSQGQTTVRVVGTDLANIANPQMRAEAMSEVARVAPEAAANIASDRQGSTPVQVIVVMTMHPVADEDRKALPK